MDCARTSIESPRLAMRCRRGLGGGTEVASYGRRRRKRTECAPGGGRARSLHIDALRRCGRRRFLPARRHRPRPAGRHGVHRQGLFQAAPRRRSTVAGQAATARPPGRAAASGRCQRWSSGSATRSRRRASRSWSNTARASGSMAARTSWRRNAGNWLRRTCHRCPGCWPPMSTWPDWDCPNPAPSPRSSGPAWAPSAPGSGRCA